MATDTLARWELSAEYMEAYAKFAGQWHEPDEFQKAFEQSQAYRDARLAFRKRVNGGYTKGNH